MDAPERAPHDYVYWNDAHVNAWHMIERYGIDDYTLISSKGWRIKGSRMKIDWFRALDIATRTEALNCHMEVDLIEP